MDTLYLALIVISTLAGAVSLLVKAYKKSNENIQKVYEEQIRYIQTMTTQEVKNYQEITNTLKTIAALLKAVVSNTNKTQREQEYSKDKIVEAVNSCSRLCKHVEAQSKEREER